MRLPEWLFGTDGEVRRRCGAEGKRWAREYARSGAFPGLKTKDVVGDVVWIDVTKPIGTYGVPPGWITYQVQELMARFMAALEYGDRADRLRTRSALEAHIESYPWGLIELSTSFHSDPGATKLASQFERITASWDELNSVSYVFGGRSPAPLAQTLERAFDTVLAAWCGGSVGDVRADMLLAADRLRSSRRADAIARIVPILERLAAIAGVRWKQPLNAEFFRSHLENSSDREFASLRTAARPILVRAMYQWANLDRQGA